MALSVEQKKAVVSEVAEVAANAQSAVAFECQGISANEMTELRAKARSEGVRIHVVKNTLAARAFDNTGFACMSEQLVGPLVFAFSMEEPGAAARVLKEAGKTSDKIEVKILAIDGKLLDGSRLDAMAAIPTYDQAISQLMSVMKAPVEKFVRTLAEPHTKLVRTVAAVRDQKQA